MLPNGLREILDFEAWKLVEDKVNKYPLFSFTEWQKHEGPRHDRLNFVEVDAADLASVEAFKDLNNVVLVLKTSNKHAMVAMRRYFIELINAGVALPVVLRRGYQHLDDESLMIYSATDMGGLLIDGMGDGVMLDIPAVEKARFYNETMFGILQASRARITKTEYISCPSCGRTLFDLQETTAMIRKRTDHLKGIKIGIMGCIVNGPGEMADADYGYVGSGKGKITLYKGKEVMKRGVPSEKALDELIELIREDGNWIEPAEA